VEQGLGIFMLLHLMGGMGAGDAKLMGCRWSACRRGIRRFLLTVLIGGFMLW
jgi:Flp pilus assembly protein protease CpaA